MNARLQRLREVLRLEWGELAERLGLSRSMLDFVRKGQRNLSFKALSRLEDVERCAGFTPPPPIRLAVHSPPVEYTVKRERKPLDIVELKRQVAAMKRQLASLERMIEEAEHDN
jgi:transcriptional regulator with XRE-family HTH domain